MAFERLNSFIGNAMLNGSTSYIDEFLINFNCLVAAHMTLDQLAAHVIVTNSAGFHYSLFFQLTLIIYHSISESM